MVQFLFDRDWLERRICPVSAVSRAAYGHSHRARWWRCMRACKHHTPPTHMSLSRTRDFSRLAQDVSHRVRIHSVSRNSQSSHLAQHVTRALVVISFTNERYLTFHMHSSPTLYPTIYETFIVVIFTREIYPCDDPSNVSFGYMAETLSPNRAMTERLALSRSH